MFDLIRTKFAYYKVDERRISRPVLMAQDIAQVLPSSVDYKPGGISEPQGVSYTDLIPVLIAGFKEQNIKNILTERALEDLAERVSDLE